ncbi:MAG: hypothetical protein JW783_10200 [Bacteroidales bacterium]|nr:hypothetical protein [Bacteroidales bacterium]MBN2748925.1 hypothetical protein [Bacteroidales bacterium]
MKRFALLPLAALAFTSCEDVSTEDVFTEVQLVVKSSAELPTVASPAKSTVAEGIVIENFWVNISEVEFDFTDEWEDKLNDSIIAAQELQGPFLVNLMSQEALSGLSLGTTLIPNAAYEEVEFEFDRCLDASKQSMYNRSIYITGTIANTPFVLWYNNEVEFEISLPNRSSFALTGETMKLYIDFNIAQIVSSLTTMNFSLATDGNGDGVIEIGPNDADGNGDLASRIIEALEESVELDDNNLDD